MQDDQNSFQFQEVNQEVSQLLDQYLRNSKTGKTHVLKQQTPETIAEKLKLESNFIKGFTSLEDIKSFILDDGTKVHVNLKDI